MYYVCWKCINLLQGGKKNSLHTHHICSHKSANQMGQKGPQLSQILKMNLVHFKAELSLEKKKKKKKYGSLHPAKICMFRGSCGFYPQPTVSETPRQSTKSSLVLKSAFSGQHTQPKNPHIYENLAELQ